MTTTTPGQGHSPSLGGAIWRYVTNNGWLKLISALFAVILFLIVRTQQVREFPRVARLRIVTSPNVIVLGASERAVDVTVRLPESLFSRQPGDEELQGELDIRQERPGKLRVRLSRENFPTLDKRYTLVIHDPWVEVELDAAVQKKVGVKAVLQGFPRQGLAIERVVVTPDKIDVFGARRELARIDTLLTSPINIENIDKNFTSLARIAMDDYSSMRVQDEKVNVQVIVGAAKSNRIFRAVPVEVNATGRIELRPTHIEVEIRGEKEFLDELKPSDVRAFLDVEGLAPGWQEKQVRLKIPASAGLVRVVPDTVSVQITD